MHSYSISWGLQRIYGEGGPGALHRMQGAHQTVQPIRHPVKYAHGHLIFFDYDAHFLHRHAQRLHVTAEHKN